MAKPAKACSSEQEDLGRNSLSENGPPFVDSSPTFYSIATDVFFRAVPPNALTGRVINSTKPLPAQLEGQVHGFNMV